LLDNEKLVCLLTELSYCKSSTMHRWSSRGIYCI